LPVFAVAFALALVSLGACSPQHYHTRADRETYSILFEKSNEVENVEPDELPLAPSSSPDLSKLLPKPRGDEFLGDFATYEAGAKVLSLDSAVTGPDSSDAYLQIMNANLATLKSAFPAAVH
jgi:hypothetical protein